jgi:hypothetical protein
LSEFFSYRSKSQSKVRRDLNAYYPDPLAIAEAVLGFFPGRSLTGGEEIEGRPEFQEFKGPF